ncbi:MAG TPA: hypothetical protein VKQ34_05035 [Candidatus Saccharimonadales bacterium]|nr:hypothetical protein [Candidatus Saccharimonadales bacterium]
MQKRFSRSELPPRSGTPTRIITLLTGIALAASGCAHASADQPPADSDGYPTSAVSSPAGASTPDTLPIPPGTMAGPHGQMQCEVVKATLGGALHNVNRTTVIVTVSGLATGLQVEKVDPTHPDLDTPSPNGIGITWNTPDGQQEIAASARVVKVDDAANLDDVAVFPATREGAPVLDGTFNFSGGGFCQGMIQVLSPNGTVTGVKVG